MNVSGFERYMDSLKGLSYAYNINIIFDHGNVYLSKRMTGESPTKLTFESGTFNIKDPQTFEKTIQSLKGQTMEDYKLKIGDDVTINATIVGITPNNNPIIKLGSGIKFLVKETDINTIYPKPEPPKVDMRKGN